MTDPLEAAESALDAGHPDLALEHLEHVHPEDPERALLECWALLDLGRLAEARGSLAPASRELDPDDPALLLASGELALREWRIEDARSTFERLLRQERSIDALERMSLCHELQGDFTAADGLIEEAALLDPDGAPPPPRLDDADFDEVVAAAVAGLPETYRRALERARLVTEPVPFLDLVLPEDPAATPPDLLGLFVGATLHELAEDAPAQLPPAIYLFQRNLERAARNGEHLREEIRTTLFHELGHLLGLDEDEVDALGLG